MSYYLFVVKPFDWNQEKNRELIEERDVCFEDVVTAVDEDKILDDLPHPNKTLYPNQRMLIVVIRDYCYLVPYVEDEEKKFLKTIIPSRKATKKYLIDIKEGV